MNKRPITIFPSRVFLDQPGKAVERGMAVRRVRDGVVMFRAEGDNRQILVREEYLMSAYDLSLSPDQNQILGLIKADNRGYAWGYAGDLPGTKKALTQAQKNALRSLLLRGIVTDQGDERYVITEHGQRVVRANDSLYQRRVTA